MPNYTSDMENIRPIRQGDIILRPIKRLNSIDKERLARSKPRTLQMHSETGHHHTINGVKYIPTTVKGSSEAYLMLVENPVEMEHIEHSLVALTTIERGIYEVSRTRQFSRATSKPIEAYD